jgi:hypothetical protein
MRCFFLINRREWSVDGSSPTYIFGGDGRCVERGRTPLRRIPSFKKLRASALSRASPYHGCSRHTDAVPRSSRAFVGSHWVKGLQDEPPAALCLSVVMKREEKGRKLCPELSFGEFMFRQSPAEKFDWSIRPTSSLLEERGPHELEISKPTSQKA